MSEPSSGAAPRDVTDVERYTRKSGTSFYYSFLFLPRAKRKGIFAVYAFCRAVDDAVDESPDPGEAAKKLEQWEKEISNAYRGEPETAVGRAVAETLQRFDIPRRHFQEVIAGVRMDLERNRYKTFEDLRPYCDRVAGAVGLICIRIFGVTGERADEYARNLGTGLQLINIMRDVGGDAARGRIYLPTAELERFGVTEDEILESRYTPRFAALLSHQAERARSYLARADASRFGARRSLLFPAEAMGAIYAALLRNIEKADYNVFDQRIRVGRMKKIAIVLSLRLRGLRRRFAAGDSEGDAEAG